MKKNLSDAYGGRPECVDAGRAELREGWMSGAGRRAPTEGALGAREVDGTTLRQQVADRRGSQGSAHVRCNRHPVPRHSGEQVTVQPASPRVRDMSHRLGGRLASVLVPVAALVLPATAHAEKVVTEDSVGDVVTIDESSATLQGSPAPDYAGVDVVRTAVAHGANRLRVVVQFRALERESVQFTVVRVVTPDRKYDVVVERLGGAPIANLSGGRRIAQCRALKAKVDLGADTVTATLPTSCIGSPRWVQVGVGAVAVTAEQGAPEMVTGYVDDAHRDGQIRDSLAKGPKGRRG